MHQLHDVDVIHASDGTSAAVSWDGSVYLIFSRPFFSIPPVLFFLCYAHWSAFANMLPLRLNGKVFSCMLQPVISSRSLSRLPSEQMKLRNRRIPCEVRRCNGRKESHSEEIRSDDPGDKESLLPSVDTLYLRSKASIAADEFS